MTPFHFDIEFQREQLAIIRSQELHGWLEKQLTDEQRVERERQRIAIANGRVRAMPTVFSSLE